MLDATQQQRPWRRAGLWLLLLGPFFFLSYGFANWYAAQSANVGSIVFAWEQHIPFIPWTIIPYWSIDLLYAISLFVCTSKAELDSHARRLLTAQVIAVTCFIAFPLTFSFTRPDIAGVSGWLFKILGEFDQPFNQAPSLHIALLVILWVLFPRHLPRSLIWPFHILGILIAVSVLTTYQHHFIDVPSGALLGWLCVWLWPQDGGSMLQMDKSLRKQPRRWCIAGYYLLASTGLVVVAFYFAGIFLWLLWPAVSLLLVAVNYTYVGSKGFQKDANGRMSPAAKWLFYPYLLGALINSRLWTWRHARMTHIMDNVYLGRFPAQQDIRAHQFHSVLDMTAEFAASHDRIKWFALANLDLLVPADQELIRAAQLIEQQQQQGKLLVTCALGYSRSAMAVLTWLLLTKRTDNVEQALALLRDKANNIVINRQARQTLAALAVAVE